ncbi:cytosolic phospholipase A2 [Cherax quadricarinatus]|uniref:cytosolic phospholipase A2 n=1 Tax=Cherax quadricarinatus TaxID=27406 RepID=UPI00387E4688
MIVITPSNNNPHVVEDTTREEEFPEVKVETGSHESRCGHICIQVEHEACLDLEIKIDRGESITKGSTLQDLMDTPDPYVILRIPGSSNPSKRTSHVDNCTNPLCEERHSLSLKPNLLKPLLYSFAEAILMDANYTMDETLGEDTFCVNELPNDIPMPYTFIFPGGSKVHAVLTLQKNKVPDLRFSLALCNEEKEFLQTRRQKVLVAMKKLLGDKAPDTEQQVKWFSFQAFHIAYNVLPNKLQFTTSHFFHFPRYISTLYSHDLFPNVTHAQIQKELRDSVTMDWKWKLLNAPKYVASMVAKYKQGQPVSFTDFFGHLLGDVLLKGQKHKKLTESQRILVQGVVPMPLYTCLHAKKKVSCRSFSEWVEFSPFEIGIAKYGTFMKTQDFGCKFIVGKKIKHFDEFPLHFLQGVWGSAFTVLIKTLVMEGGKKDIVQIMRDAQKDELENQRNDTHSSGESSDSEDEEDIQGKDDKESEEESDEHRSTLKQQFKLQPLENGLSEFSKSVDQKTNQNKIMQTSKSFDSLSLNDSEERRKLSGKTEEDLKQKNRKFSFDVTRRKISKEERKTSSASDPGGNTELQTARASRLTRKGAIKGSRIKKDDAVEQNVWSERRKTLRRSRIEKKAGLWDALKQNIMTGTNILNSRAGRAGEVLNPFRGLSLRHSFPISPFAVDVMGEDEDQEDKVDSEMDIGISSRYRPLDNTAKKLFIVDSGLAFNSPYPLLLRPQRAVDIYLSFDFSQRTSDKTQPFKELLFAEKWAIQNKVPFPPIENQVAQYENEEVRECYVFRHPTDQFCPVILHFPLVNNKFKNFKAPGMLRK